MLKARHEKSWRSRDGHLKADEAVSEPWTEAGLPSFVEGSRHLRTGGWPGHPFEQEAEWEGRL